MSNALRLFIALELPTPVLEALEAVQGDLRARLPDRAARWVRPEGIHLTLKFLGDVPSEQVDDIAGALRTCVKGYDPIELRVEGLGVFPNPRRARVLWTGVGGDVDALRRLHASVEQHIAPVGYPTESRRFNPHLTLARARRNATPAEREAIGTLVSDHDVGHLATWEVSSVGLIRSQLKPSGAVYTQLAQATLTGEI
jgi:2'-5' RNA ligase